MFKDLSPMQESFCKFALWTAIATIALCFEVGLWALLPGATLIGVGWWYVQIRDPFETPKSPTPDPPAGVVGPSAQSPQTSFSLLNVVEGVFCVVFVIVVVITLFRREKPPRDYVSREDVRLTAVRLNGSWAEDDELLGVDSEQWHGSAFVIGSSNGDLLLVTNSHCLGLNPLARADDQSDHVSDVSDYQLEVTFPSGKKRKVLRMAETTGSVDLAQLTVSAKGLQQGVDYVPIAVSGNTPCQPGDIVVAIGTPIESYYDGTQTHGRISAIRERIITGEPLRVIQHDAAINGGNSGGPLFLESKGKFYPLGVNTWQASGGQGIFFSISMSEIPKARFLWSTADARGAVDLIQQAHGQRCKLLRP